MSESTDSLITRSGQGRSFNYSSESPLLLSNACFYALVSLPVFDRLLEICHRFKTDFTFFTDNGPAGQPHHAHNTLLTGQYGARIVTHFSVVKL